MSAQNLSRRQILQAGAAAGVTATAAAWPLARQAQAAERRFEPQPGDWRRFELVTEVTVPQARGTTRLWLPVPTVEGRLPAAAGQQLDRQRHRGAGVLSITSCVYADNQKRKQGNELTNNYWWQANFIGRFSFNERLSLSGRVEYFSDANNVQISAINPNISGFSAFSGGLCLNVKIKKQALLRFDGRYFGAQDNLFIDKNNLPSKSALWLVSNMTVWFY